MTEKLLKIINHYEIENQLKKFSEESYELIEAIIRHNELYEIDGYSCDLRIKHITEEIADVEVMLLQFKEYYHIDGNEILEIMNKKIDRQLKRMEKENNGKQN